jgi:hypothetical protein
MADGFALHLILFVWQMAHGLALHPVFVCLFVCFTIEACPYVCDSQLSFQF